MPEIRGTAAPTTAPPAPGGGHDRRRQILALLCACVVLVVGMVAAINLAIPKIGDSGLHPSSSELLWIVDSYVIVFAGLLIPAGVFGDHFGHRRALSSGLAVFVLGSVVSAVSTGSTLLIAGRAVMGIGAALVLPATLSVIVNVFPPAERPQAIASWTAMTGLGGVVGNLGGGAVLQYLPWQSLFWASAPIALALLLLVRAAVPITPVRQVSQDPVGAALLIGGFLSLLYAIIEGPGEGWASAPVLVGFAAAVVLLVAFVLYELKREHPLLDPRLFKLPKIRSGALGIGVTFFGMFALFFVNAQYLQYVKDFSPLATGLGILPLAAGMLLVSRRSIGLAKRFGARPVVAAGIGSVTVGLALLSLADRHTPYPLYALYLLIMAAGAGLTAPPLSMGIMGSLPPTQAGLGSGINSSTRELGSALGVAIVGTVLNARFSTSLPDALKGSHSSAQAIRDSEALGVEEHLRVVDSFTHALTIGYRIVAVVVLVAGLLVTTWFREPKSQPASPS
ncbi:MFS transporter [Streptomyces sp. NRRL WC-3742]|uniref:MFS transporter n=1 Tax=Streptomyces sp. NRRL WC-3742 TaxID=1463934 RepID=UPI00068F5757|nr:MFS transporter [Streptomyces sp. NRRL WC-3742]